MTGTVTTMQDNQELQLTGVDDVLIRGTINVLGQGSDLAIQSNKWVYLDTEVNVPDQVRIYGGVDLNGTTNTSSTPRQGASVYVDRTSTINTTDAASQVDIRGAEDVDIRGAVIAGGTVGSTGVTWKAPGDGVIKVIAGQQVYVDSGLQASKDVHVTGGTPGSDDSRVAVWVTSAGGMNAAGIASSGGGAVEIRGDGGLSMLGTITSGATLDAQGTPTWNSADSTVLVDMQGAAIIGGNVPDAQGNQVEVGGTIRAKASVDLRGKNLAMDPAVRVPGGGVVTAEDSDGAIKIVGSAGDAQIEGFVIAGGKVERVNDAGGKLLGLNPSYYDGDSTIVVRAGHQVKIGQVLRAGKEVDVVGGVDPQAMGPIMPPDLSMRSIVILGSGHVEASRPNASVNLAAPGKIEILPAPATYQITPAGFAAAADGKLTSDVTLKLKLTKGGSDVDATATLMKTDTDNNTSVTDLATDLQAALATATGGTDITVVHNNGKLLFRSTNKFEFQATGSSHANLLGLMGLTGSAKIEAARPTAIVAAGAGSTVNVGGITLDVLIKRSAGDINTTVTVARATADNTSVADLVTDLNEALKNAD